MKEWDIEFINCDLKGQFMNKEQWYNKLNLWACEDSRLETMPLVYLRPLAEHIANAQAVEQSAQADAKCLECLGINGTHSKTCTNNPAKSKRIKG